MENLDLSTFHNEWYRPGRSRTVQALWFFLGAPIVRCSLNPSSGLRALILRLFGARIGAGAVLKPGLRIKYPWRLSVGDHTWLGEDCWIDNLADVAIGSHVCISQGAFLCTGNHDWSDPSFALKLGPITIRDGAWVGARALVCPGVEVGKLAILVAGSVARKNLPDGEIHGGNPAAFLKFRYRPEAAAGPASSLQEMANPYCASPSPQSAMP